MHQLQHTEEGLNILADVVIANAEQSNCSGPGSDNLAGQLAARILSVCAESDDTTNNSKSNSIANHNRMISILLGLFLCRFLLCSGLFFQLLGLFLNLLFARYALSLRVGFDGLRLVVGGHRGNVGAVYVDERVNTVFRRVLDLWRGGSTTVVCVSFLLGAANAWM